MGAAPRAPRSHPAEVNFTTEFNSELRFIGNAPIYRRYYEVHAGAADRRAQAHGRERDGNVSPETLFNLRLTPYDSFAVWLHYLRQCGVDRTAEIGE
jgi:hypothetical protein